MKKCLSIVMYKNTLILISVYKEANGVARGAQGGRPNLALFYPLLQGGGEKSQKITGNDKKIINDDIK